MMQLMERITQRGRFLPSALRKSALLVVLLVLSPLLGLAQAGDEPESAPAYSEPVPQYRIKAAFLYKFTRYITWPDGCFSNDESPIIIGILGKDPFGDVLDDTLKGHRTNNRPFVVRRFKNIGEIDHCHLVFISGDERRQKDYLKQLAGRPIVTVGESDGFLSSGGIINLITLEDSTHKSTVRFEVNMKVAKPVGIKISARMLNLATRVIQEENKPNRQPAAGRQALRVHPAPAPHYVSWFPPRS
jgi:hypothetical protein